MLWKEDIPSPTQLWQEQFAAWTEIGEYAKSQIGGLRERKVKSEDI
jgi:hypothetical protein